MANTEIPLSGGNTNASIVRVGNTVRRALRPSSATVNRLLSFLQCKGYDKAPKFLGIDAHGREILSYIEGTCEISPSVWHSTAILESTARALKQLHDLTALYSCRDDDQWGFSYPDSSRHEVICHNDFGLYNLVTNNNKLVGIIDFDLAGPGPRLWDVAYAVYWLAPMSFNAEDMKAYTLEQQRNGFRRLKLFCEVYGVVPDATLLDMISEVLHHMADEHAMTRLFGSDVSEQLKRDGHLSHWRAEAQAFDDSRTCIDLTL